MAGGGMKHIVYHHDVDGIVSAAIFLHNHARGETYRLYPLPSTTRGVAFSKMVDSLKADANGYDDQNYVAVLDFEWHEKADLWVDHHFTPRFGECVVSNESMLYDPKSKSAARLVHAIPSRYRNYPAGFLHMADMIDAADYKSVDQIFYDTHPLMAVRTYIEQSYPSAMMLNRIVEMMASCHFDLRRCNAQLGIGDEGITKAREDAHKCEKSVVLMRSFSYLEQRRPNQFPRYAEFYVYPKIKYFIRSSTAGNGVLYIQIGYNRWLREGSKINIGESIRNCKMFITGGGHYNVGAGTIKLADADAVLEYFDELFNGSEESMEKYGVDQSDSVEARAIDLVKTGAVKTIDEARRVASAFDGDKSIGIQPKPTNGEMPDGGPASSE